MSDQFPPAAGRFTSPSPGVVGLSRAYDHLSDEEVVRQHILPLRPVTDAQNIWAFWHTGWDAMPVWRQRTCIDWVRRQGPAWQLRVLDAVDGSPWNAVAYLGPDAFAACCLNGSIFEHDSAGAQHFSDFVRIGLLVRYGGVWIDAGMALQRNLEHLGWNRLNDPADPTELLTVVITNDYGPNLILQGFIAALPNNVFLTHWKRLYIELWKGASNSASFHRHPLLHNFPQLRLTPPWRQTFGPDLTTESVNDYLSHQISASRLICIHDIAAGWNGPAYWKQHVRLLSSSELFPLACLYYGNEGYTESRQWELLCLPRPADPVAAAAENPEQRHAQRLCEAMIAESSFQKHANGPYSIPTVARLWTEYPGTDIAPGTWAEYARWGRIYADQTQRSPKLWTPGEDGLKTLGKCWITGILEPVTSDTKCIDVEQ